MSQKQQTEFKAIIVRGGVGWRFVEIVGEQGLQKGDEECVEAQPAVAREHRGFVLEGYIHVLYRGSSRRDRVG